MTGELFAKPARPGPRQAVLLSAGYGRRMRPLTELTAKPLVSLAGQSLLDHALDRLAASDVDEVVVNAHWHGDQIERRLLARAAHHPGTPCTVIQHEPELLDTGGGVLAALQSGLIAADAPFFVVNGDSLWLDGPNSALCRLAAGFDRAGVNKARLDALLLVSRTAWAVGDVGRGDFLIDPDGFVRRRTEQEVVPYVYAGVQIVSPRLFEGIEAIAGTAFSMNLVWDRAIEAGRLRALVHDGPWFHLSRPADIAAAELAIRDPTFGPSNT